MVRLRRSLHHRPARHDLRLLQPGQLPAVGGSADGPAAQRNPADSVRPDGDGSHADAGRKTVGIREQGRKGELWIIRKRMFAPRQPGCWFCCWRPWRAATSGAGCCNDIAPGAIPQPNGTYDCQWVHAGDGQGQARKFVIYQYEWTTDGAKLTPAGQEHLAEIAKAIACVPYPVVIEPVADDQLNGLAQGGGFGRPGMCSKSESIPTACSCNIPWPKGFTAKRRPGWPPGCSADTARKAAADRTPGPRERTPRNHARRSAIEL